MVGDGVRQVGPRPWQPWKHSVEVHAGSGSNPGRPIKVA